VRDTLALILGDLGDLTGYLATRKRPLWVRHHWRTLRAISRRWPIAVSRHPQWRDGFRRSASLPLSLRRGTPQRIRPALSEGPSGGRPLPEKCSSREVDRLIAAARQAVDAQRTTGLARCGRFRLSVFWNFFMPGLTHSS